MKQIIFTCLLLGAISNADAQSAMNHGNWESNTKSKSKAHQREPNEFDGTEMMVEERTITFANLPEVKKSAWAVVADASGEVMVQRKISSSENSMDVRRLSRGELYFVHIMYKDQSQKGFVLHL